MSLTARLTEIFGKERVRDDEGTLLRYAQDQSFSPRRMPGYVVFAETVEEVQRLLKLANETGTPVVPFSSGLNFHGAALPDQGGIILDMSRMNRILHVDEKNWFAVVEPGVTYEQLQGELMRRGFRIMVPFGVHPARSVLTSYLERDPVLASASFEHGNFLIMDTEIVLPDGEVFKTGLWSSGGEPGGPLGPVRNILFRLWTGAQGTLGVMTRMVVQISPFVRERKVYCIAYNDLSEAIEPLRMIQKREIGLECFLLNRFNLAALFSEEWRIPDEFPASPKASESFDRLRKLLPPWLMIICIQGGVRQPAGKIAYEEDALKEVCEKLNVAVTGSLAPLMGFDRLLLKEMMQPWGILKKFNYRGSVHDISFKTSLAQVVRMEAVLNGVCDAGGYDSSSVGGYILPLERGRALHCEFDLHCDRNDPAETEKVRRVWFKGSEALMNERAYFDRPYGSWADMVFKRSGNYTLKLKEIKVELDPRGILNPGKLCF